jgi:hypothetical protein
MRYSLFLSSFPNAYFTLASQSLIVTLTSLSPFPITSLPHPSLPRPHPLGDMNEKIEGFSMRCKKLPARLREYNAYKTLKSQIEDFQVVMPILQEFTKVLDAWEQIRIV